MRKGPMKDAASAYLERIKRYCPADMVDVKEESSSLKMPKEEVLKREAARVLERLKAGDYVVAMSETGKQMGSREFARFIEGLASGGRKGLSFIVGGAWGIHQSVFKSSDLVMSLSEMTLPHDLARVVLLEQVYRAFTIMKNEPYSH